MCLDDAMQNRPGRKQLPGPNSGIVPAIIGDNDYAVVV